MKTVWKDTAVSLLMGLVVPWVMISVTVNLLAGRETQEIAFTPAESVSVAVRMPEGMVELPLEEYLVGVVLAEMPADFELEALKAQAVAARTYAVKAMEQGGKHGDGSVCMDYTCCQAYLSPAQYTGNPARVQQAVQETAGEVLTYDGELIEAVFFSCSGGRTEDAKAVWGTSFPYLNAADSPETEDYGEECFFTRSELETLLAVSLPDSPAEWFTEMHLTDGGGVETVTVGERRWKGTELRRLLGLRSTVMTVVPESDGVVISTVGYGHRVGMSQYGAEAMAADGKGYRQILAHYYQGAVAAPHQS